MSYAVKEIFYTLQGEGAQAGRAAVFCRFAGAISGRGARRTGLRRSASFAIRILWAWMDRAGENLTPPKLWRRRSKRSGLGIPRSESGSWFAPAESRCCNWMQR